MKYVGMPMGMWIALGSLFEESDRGFFGFGRGGGQDIATREATGIP